MTIDFLRLHHAFTLDVRAAPSSADEIQQLYRYIGREAVPEEYIVLISQFSEAEIRIMDEGYLRIWGAAGCVEMNASYRIQHYMPGALAIGDDEGGQVIFYARGSNGFGLYKTGFGNLDMQDAVFIARALTDLLVLGKGIERLI
ncbi:SMI1/KNR4 family protein [Affinibrenneria salicis]|uniref:SMI1/KNR4 family protein n=1 Tax=Affinibrenneria salicis TaxID=2590031 RepID=A0A5J5G4V9_9GAMM|nr:SMI1/KNR4 family protein [Affinibrenneria salicis]KAA9002010.1 SMI1/KNR4 family protein [Affinibrenneria salicis]